MEYAIKILGSDAVRGTCAELIKQDIKDNPDIAIAPSFLVGFGLMIGIPLGIAIGKINLASWSFTLWCFGGVIIFCAADFGLYRLLNKENIVLSNKGNL